MAHVHDARLERTAQRVVTIVAVVLALVTLGGVFALYARDDPRELVDLGLVSEVYDAEVVATEQGPCEGTRARDAVNCDRVEFELTQGPDDGETTTIDFPESTTTPDLGVGDHVVLSYNPDADPGFQYQYSDRQRRPVLLWLAVLFAVAVIALGRLKGVAALAGLGASLVVIVLFMLPAMLDGASPVLVAVVGGSAIAYLALYLAHGFKSLTTVALLGTLASLGLAVVLASVFTELARISGFASEEAVLVSLSSEIDLAGLVLAGMVVGALGALDDVTITQASAVAEVRAADPTMSRRRLASAGLRVGRDHVASTVNTLALAYAGAALPLLILFVLSAQSLGTVANSEVIAVEIIAALVGSIGLVAAVPLTTWLAVIVVEGPADDDWLPPAPRLDDADVVSGSTGALPVPPDEDELTPPPPRRRRRRGRPSPPADAPAERDFWDDD
jgi:uncharacterized membrane protein